MGFHFNLAPVLAFLSHATYGLSALNTDLDTLLVRLSAAKSSYLNELSSAHMPADLDTLLSRLSATRAGNLDYLTELGSAHIPADIDTLLSRLTATRAGYLNYLTELSSAHIPADIDTLKTYCDILDHATYGLINLKALIDAVQADLGDVGDTAHVTFPSSSATALAYLKGQQIAQGLCYYADITGYTDTTHFASTTLAGFETHFFKGWYCFLIRDAGGVTPQGARSLVTAFTTSTGAIVLASPLPSPGASGDQIMLVHPVLMDAWNLRGGVEGIQDIIENQNAQLDTARGKKTVTMDGNEQDLYGESSDTEFCLNEFRVDLHNMAEGDTILVKVYTTEEGTERKVSNDEANTFTGPQDPARQEIIGSSNMVWGREDISITAEQKDGTNREIVCYWRDSKRGS